MPLTVATINAAKPTDKTRRLWDQRGLYLEISPKGGRYWRWKYRLAGKEKRLAIGVYPAVSLAEARRKADEARLQLLEGRDPSLLKRKAQAVDTLASDTFEANGRAWFDRHILRKSEGHRVRVERQLTQDLFPWLGNVPINQIDPPMVLSCLRRVVSAVSDHETA
jgi:hypothetical protein